MEVGTRKTLTSIPTRVPPPSRRTTGESCPAVSQWTVPLSGFAGSSPNYVNPSNGSKPAGRSPLHDGSLFFTDTNGGANFTSSNPEVSSTLPPLQQLTTDLANNTVGQYNIITPDAFNDMHTPLTNGFTYHGVNYPGNSDQAAVAEGDNFLSLVIPQIMASQAYQHNGVIVIWFDETEGDDPVDDSYSTTIPEIIISPLAKGNAYDSTLNYTHSSDLKTWQEVFSVSAPGGGFLGDANTPGTNDLLRHVCVVFAGKQLTSSDLRFAVIGDYGSGNQAESDVAQMVQSWNPAFVTTVGGNNYPVGSARRRSTRISDNSTASCISIVRHAASMVLESLAGRTSSSPPSETSTGGALTLSRTRRGTNPT